MTSARLGSGLPRLLSSGRRNANGFAAEFERVVRPIIEQTLTDEDQHERVYSSLLATGTKLSFLILGYAEMAGVEFRIDLAVLGSALARLYDDLIDEIGAPGLDRRLAGLFGGMEFVPKDNSEQLIASLYGEAFRRLRRDHDDPVHSSLTRLHEYQMRSRRQLDPAISRDDLLDITLGKGGYGVAVLFGMMRPAMDSAEHQLILELGGALQLLDDYQDFELDRLSGITTCATHYSLSLSDVVARLKTSRRHAISFYDRDKVSKFFSVVYATLWISYFRRRFPRAGTRHPATSRSTGNGPGRASAMLVLLRPGDNLGQRAADRSRRGRGDEPAAG